MKSITRSLIASKAGYWLKSACRQLSTASFSCPNCGSETYSVVDRKYLVTSLRRCRYCSLMYRVPPDGVRANFDFYQSSYRQGFTTECADEAALQDLIACKFEGTGKSYQAYIAILRSLGLQSGARIFDYGCSWGYGSWQLMDAGYSVTAYEISVSRAAYARERLGVNCVRDGPERAFAGDLQHSFDCFFSAHVLEHVPSPHHVINLAKKALRHGGIFVALTPNGSEALKRRDPHAWHLSWGQVHPNLLDDEFYYRAFAGARLHLDSSPVSLDNVDRFSRGERVPTTNLDGGELLCLAVM